MDDDLQTCELIKAVLISAGMEAGYLTDSRAAAARLYAEKTDLLFLDLHMPGQGGLELLKGMRDQGVNKRTPVAVITGDTDPKVLARGFQAGASYFLFKPIELNRLMRLVRATEASVYRERRRFQRVSVSRPATVICRGERINGATLDISLGGTMFRGDRMLEEKSQVDIEIQLGPGAAHIHAGGRVARRLDDGSMGIEFTRLKAEEAHLLQLFLLPMILTTDEPAHAPARQGRA